MKRRFSPLLLSSEMLLSGFIIPGARGSGVGLAFDLPFDFPGEGVEDESELIVLENDTDGARAESDGIRSSSEDWSMPYLARRAE